MNDDTPASVTPLPEPDLTGRELGDYHLLRRIGRGGMAEVYLAEQVSLGRQVAIKVLRRSLVDDGTYVRRFHHEARAAAALVHANIVQVHEVGCIEGIHFIAQEYVPGQNLKQVVSRQGPLDLPAALLILRQVAAALNKSGQQGIVHRDIKPENIMLGPEGEVKVADFGLARVVGNGEMTSMTQVGVTMGTPLYMSPEQVEGKSIDPRSDLYSLGVTMYFVLTGRPPFEGDSPLAVAMQHVRNKPQRLELARPDLPEGVCRLIHRLLAKSPEERFASAAELLTELRGLRVEGLEEGWYEESGDWGITELTATATQGHSEVTQQLTQLMREASDLGPRRGLVLWLVAGIAAAFLVGVVLAWMSRPPSLLTPDPNAALPRIEKRDSVQAQYLYAVMAPSEAAWQSVWEYFPPGESETNRYYQRRAQHQLGWLYLDNGQYDQAMEVFDQLATLPDTEKQFRAIGLAGQAAVYYWQGEYERSQGRILDARALFNELDTNDFERDRDLREDLRRELESYQRLNEAQLNS